jgi:hypothetical protein
MKSPGQLEITHWKSLAQQWSYFGPPLRPSREDLEFVARSVNQLSELKPGEPLWALILGVTPELANLSWPRGTSLTALDNNPEMIQFVWPGSKASSERVVHGDWLDPPLPPRSFDFVVGDGVLSMLPFDGGYGRLAAAMASIAKAGATWNLRLYVRADRPESPANVIDDLMAMKIGSFHAFKLRLAMAIHGVDDANGVRVADVWRYWEAARVDVSKLVEHGWPLEVIRMIEAYRDSPACYTFPPLEAVLAVLRQFAEVTAVSHPTYEMGERCPSVSLRFPA